jgi:hypothetical protein
MGQLFASWYLRNALCNLRTFNPLGMRTSSLVRAMRFSGFFPE